MQHDQGQFRGTGDIELTYQRWRPEGQASAVLAFVHGLGEHSGRYMNLVNHLVPLGYALVGYDLRGHGRSPGKRGHISAWSEYRDDLAAFLDHASLADCPLFLMGHSLGGLIVLEYVLYHGDRPLAGVIGSGVSLTASGLSAFVLAMGRILSRILPALQIKTGLDPTTISRDPAVVRAYQEDPLVHGLGTPRLSTESLSAMERTLARAAEWQLPLLLLHGGADRLVPIAPTRSFFQQVTIADKQMIEYPGGYHEPHNDIHHPQVTADLERWLAQHLNPDQMKGK